ncbi:MAG: galactokinase [Eubacteriales bacterium]
MTNRELVERFIHIYGGTDKDIRIFQAPGRINLIGEHIDYNGGHVFPVALEYTNTVIARPNGTNKINMAVSSLPNRVSAEIDNLEAYKDLSWGNYQLGVAYVLQQTGYPIVGCDLYYHGTVPYGAGLSSSASIEVATATALLSLGGEEKLDFQEIALLSQRAENEYVGMNCGIMDQFISANAKEKHAMVLDCATLDFEHIPLDLGEYTIVITNTNAPHKLTETQYNQRRSECEAALAIINQNGGDYQYLCEMKEQDLKTFQPKFGDEMLYRRARHCVTEEARVQKAVDVLKAGDIETFGKLLNEANISIRDDYEATGPELDAVFDIALTLPGVVGSRMTGGGFGGCNISLVKKDSADAFEKEMAVGYQEKTGIAPTFYRSSAGQGAGEVTNWV